MGELIKNYIETNNLNKSSIAYVLGISTQTLSNIYKKKQFKVEMFEKICNAIGLNPGLIFDGPYMVPTKQYSDISAQTVIGDSSVNIGQQNNSLMKLIEEKDRLIAEKERTIQILLKYTGQKDGSELGQTL